MAQTEPFEDTTIQAIEQQVNGGVLQPGDEGTDTVRTVWNAPMEKEPGLFARCRGAVDVIAAVDFARVLDQ